MLTYVKQGLIKRIHVDRRIVAQNRKRGENKPAITVQLSGGPLKARRVTILGNSEAVQADDVRVRPLSCGARIWIETKAAVEVFS
jgi:hypothetical protein